MLTSSMVILAATLAIAAPKHAVPESIILGDWCAGSKYAFHEEFALAIDEDGHTFMSWLHHKPALDGSWELRDRTLTIRGRHGDTMSYTILSATGKRLVLRQR